MKVYSNIPHVVSFIKFSLVLNIVAITIATHQVVAAYTTKNATAIRIRRVPIMFSRKMNYSNELFNYTYSPDTTNGASGVPGGIILCSESIEEFPHFFTDEQRKQGAVILPFIFAVYCFTVLAIICDNYFLPCVERICDALNLSQDVAAATFMSIATSAPELFSNIIGTFITESDIGIGTVVGSSLFNTLGVASIGGLAATSPIQLDWWPLTRDCSIYICSIILLVLITWDNQIFWYEALVLFIVYFIYLTVMFQNVRISRFFKNSVKRFCKRKISEEPIKHAIELSTITTIEEELTKYIEHKEQQKEIELCKEQKEKKFENGQTTITITSAKQTNEDDEDSLFKFPKGYLSTKLLFIYTWPIKFVLFCTVPDCKKHKKVFPITFVMCVIWIALNSYVVSWMVTIIGSTFGIQDSVLGLTFLAAGGCLPEAISITITSRRGEGRMGVSNALGANTMNILLSLGLPWFIKTLILVAKNGSSRASIKIVSGSMEYTILALIIVAITLYVCLSWNKFRLSRKSGAILMCFYLFFLICAILSEMLLFQPEQCQQVTS